MAPRAVPEWQSTAYWECTSCHHCGAYRLALRLWPHTRTGDEITTAHSPWLALPTSDLEHAIVTSDGSVVRRDGHARAGAAILWRPAADDGH